MLGPGTDDFGRSVFYTTPEEMEAAAKRHGLTKVSNLGLDFFLAASVIDAMSEETFALYQPLADRMCAPARRAPAGVNHALLVCRKRRAAESFPPALLCRWKTGGRSYNRRKKGGYLWGKTLVLAESRRWARNRPGAGPPWRREAGTWLGRSMW